MSKQLEIIERSLEIYNELKCMNENKSYIGRELWSSANSAARMEAQGLHPWMPHPKDPYDYGWF